MKRILALLLVLAAALALAGCGSAAPAQSAGEASSASLAEENPIVSIAYTADETMAFPDVLEPFYTDEQNVYSFSTPHSEYVTVTYADGSSENIVAALNAGRAVITDLDAYGIAYYTSPRQ